MNLNQKVLTYSGFTKAIPFTLPLVSALGASSFCSSILTRFDGGSSDASATLGASAVWPFAPFRTIFSAFVTAESSGKIGCGGFASSNCSPSNGLLSDCSGASGLGTSSVILISLICLKSAVQGCCQTPMLIWSSLFCSPQFFPAISVSGPSAVLHPVSPATSAPCTLFLRCGFALRALPFCFSVPGLLLTFPRALFVTSHIFTYPISLVETFRRLCPVLAPIWNDVSSNVTNKQMQALQIV